MIIQRLFVRAQITVRLVHTAEMADDDSKAGQQPPIGVHAAANASLPPPANNNTAAIANTTPAPHSSILAASPFLPALASHRSIVILYGSQSGSAAELASRLALDAYQHSFHTITLLPLDDFDLSQLPTTHLLFIVISTQGQGEPPDNARTFYSTIMRRSLPSTLLAHTHFSLFALGDSSYPIYNAAGRRVYQRLLELGALSICRRGMGDDQDANGYEDGWSEWRDELWRRMEEQVEWLASRSDEEKRESRDRLPPATFTVALQDESKEDEEQDKLIATNSVTPLVDETNTVHWCTCAAALPLPISSSSPVILAPVQLPPVGMGSSISTAYPALLTQNIRLTPATHFQDVRHLRFQLPPSSPPAAFSFQPGDVVDIFPRNEPAAVTAFLRAMDYDPAAAVHTDYNTPSEHSRPLPLPVYCTLQELFEVHLDVQGTPKRSFFRFLSRHATDEMQREKLEEFDSTAGQEELRRYCDKEKRTYAEVLIDFHTARPPLSELVSNIPRLQPRAFSISSSSLLHPGYLDVTAALVRFTTPWKRERTGVCSNFISLLPQSSGSDQLSSVVYVPIRIRKGSFHIPKAIGWDGPPAVLIGPGTGVAPFRAMCQHKAAHLSSSSATATATDSSMHNSFSPYALFFGNRNASADYLYRDEWLQHHSTSTLAVPPFTAFSRDQPQKLYVQDVMCNDVAASSLLYDWVVQRGGYVFVAGSSGSMPRGVRRALEAVLCERGGMTEEEAAVYVRRMEKERRYIQEVW